MRDIRTDESSHSERKRKKGKEKVIEEKCGGDEHCKKVELENEKARERLGEQDRKYWQDQERKQNSKSPPISCGPSAYL